MDWHFPRYIQAKKKRASNIQKNHSDKHFFKTFEAFSSGAFEGN